MTGPTAAVFEFETLDATPCLFDFTSLVELLFLLTVATAVGADCCTVPFNVSDGFVEVETVNGCRVPSNKSLIFGGPWRVLGFVLLAPVVFPPGGLFF